MYEAREVSEEDKALASHWLKRIDAAGRLCKDDEKRFADNRKWLRGKCPKTGNKLRTNLHFANLAAMRPQVYAKDPEFAVTPTGGVPEEQLEVWRGFGETAEAVLGEVLVRGAKLKKRAKRLLTSGYASGVGWWKVCWQENRQTDSLIGAKMKDRQDNVARLEREQKELQDPTQADEGLKSAQLQQTAAGLQSQSEVVVARGVTVDFCLPEDIRILDSSVREIEDYDRSEAIAHRVWMTRERYKETFGYDSQKARIFTEQSGVMRESDDKDKSSELVAVWEVWQQATGRVFTVCEGEEGFCKAPYSPSWTGKRWYPFFLLCFNSVDGGGMYPPSDVDLTIDVVNEYNDTRNDFARDRKKSLPLNVVRKGGLLTPEDVQRISNRTGDEWAIVVDGPGGRPLSEDIFTGQLAQIRGENYDTSPARTDMEMLVGGGDAARGTVMTAKTATEAEILAQGMRGRSAERTDVIEDMLSEVGTYALEMCLRKMSLQEVQQIAGMDAQWPQLRAEDVFKMVSLQVRGGSTGKPDRLQEQDRWIQLLPAVEKTMAQVAELRTAGQNDMAEAASELLRETMRRFDERMDLERFLPPPKEGEEGTEPEEPQITPEMLQEAQAMAQEMQAKIAELEQALADKQADVQASLQKAQIEADAKVQIAGIVAPIEAQAKVESERIAKELAAQVDVQRMALDAESGAADRANAETENAELTALREQLAQMADSQQQLAQLIVQMGAKPKMKVRHLMDPATGRLAESVLVPEETEQTP